MASLLYILLIIIMFCCRYLTVFGQGLALRGPAGSMIKAINAFNYYQKHVLLSFTLNIFFLGISTICQFYVFMTLWGAHICAILMIIGMSVWWIFCLQVFNRFKYVEEVAGWRQDHEHSRFSEVNPADALPQRDSFAAEHISAHNSVDSGAPPSLGDPSTASLAYQGNDRQDSVGSRVDMFPDDGSVSSSGTKNVAMQDATWRRRIFSKFLSNKSGSTVNGGSVAGGSVIGDNRSTTSNPMAHAQPPRSESNFEKVLHQGGMELRTFTRSQSQSPSAWMRRYCLLVNSNLLMVFTNKADYDRNPNSALCKLFKAINVSKYTYSSVEVDNTLLAVLTPLNSNSPTIEIKLDSDVETQQFLETLSRLIAAGGGDSTKKA